MIRKLLSLLLTVSTALVADIHVKAYSLFDILEFSKDGKIFAKINAGALYPGWESRKFSNHPTKQNKPGVIYGRCGNGTEKHPFIELEVRMSQSAPNTLKLEYIFTATGEFALHSLNTSLTMEGEYLYGRNFAFGQEKKGVFPPANRHFSPHVARSSAQELNIDTTMGTMTFQLSPDNSMLIQDGRNWGGNTFTFRNSVVKGLKRLPGETMARLEKGAQYIIPLTITFPEPLVIVYNTPVTFTQNDSWIPLDNKLEIEKGSVLDFTDVIKLDAPAGKYGWTKANGQNFVFEKLPGVQQRFYGVNLCFSAHDLTHEQSDILADRLARFGYNTVRFHHHENALTKANKVDSCTFDKERIDRFFYLFAALKKRGIYMTTDMYVSREVNAHEIYPGAKGTINSTEFKQLCPVNRNAMENWKKFSRAFLGTVNPYTGLTLAEDPALNTICMINEGGPSGLATASFPKQFHKAWLDAWNAWIAKNYPTPEARRSIDITKFPTTEYPTIVGPGAYGSALGRFLFDTHQAMYKEMTQFLRTELKCKALFTDMNNGGRTLWAQGSRNTFDYIDHHFYIDHPEFFGIPWRLPMKFDNLSVIKTGIVGGAYSSFLRSLDKPFTITEWNYSGPGKYRGIGGIMTGCLASLQNWAGLWRFAYSHDNFMFNPKLRFATCFDVVADPLMQINDRATICLFMRQDLKPANTTIAVSADIDWNKKAGTREQAYHFQWMGLNLIAKIGSCFGKTDTACNADISVSMTPDAPKAKHHIETTTPGGFSIGEQIFNTLRKQNWLPQGNKTDLAKNIYQTADNQFMVDGTKNTMTLNTPMTAGGFAEAGNIVETDVATFDIKDSDATVWVSSVTDEPIKSSSRILLSHVTELQNSNQKYADKDCTVLIAWGRQPYLIKNGSVNAELKLDNPQDVTVYCVDMSGKRLDKLPTTVKDGKLCFTLCIEKNGKAQLLYELTRSK